jgi:hypothetical protein
MRRRGWAGEPVAHPRHGLPVAPEGGERLIPLDPLQTPAVVLGMAGAVLVAGRGAGTRAVGFGAWVIGNALWVAYGVASGNVYVMVMFAFYGVTAVVGVVNVGKEKR